MIDSFRLGVYYYLAIFCFRGFPEGCFAFWTLDRGREDLGGGALRLSFFIAQSQVLEECKGNGGQCAMVMQF